MGYNKINFLLSIGFLLLLFLFSCNPGTTDANNSPDIEETVVETNFYEVLKAFEKEGEYYMVADKWCKKPIMDGLGCEKMRADFDDYNRYTLCSDKTKSAKRVDESTVVKGEVFNFKSHKSWSEDTYFRFSVTQWQFKTSADADIAFALGEAIFSSCDKVNSFHFVVGPYWYVFEAGGEYAYRATGQVQQYFKQMVK